VLPKPKPKMDPHLLRKAYADLLAASSRLKDLDWTGVALEKKTPSDHLMNQVLADIKKVEAADLPPLAPGLTVKTTANEFHISERCALAWNRRCVSV
jgi:hypothetical protein